MADRHCETDCTDEPVCPHCGSVQNDAWEMDFGGMEGTVETDCGACGMAIIVSRNARISYSTEKKEANNG